MMVDSIGPDPKRDPEKSVSNHACPRCSRPLADGFNLAGTEAEQLAAKASTVTLELTQFLVQLAEITAGFKEAVVNGGQMVNGELGDSLGAIILPSSK